MNLATHLLEILLDLMYWFISSLAIVKYESKSIAIFPTGFCIVMAICLNSTIFTALKSD